MAAEYVTDIYSYYKRVEPDYKVAENFMAVQVGSSLLNNNAGCTWLSLVFSRLQLSFFTLVMGHGCIQTVGAFLYEPAD